MNVAAKEMANRKNERERERKKNKSKSIAKFTRNRTAGCYIYKRNSYTLERIIMRALNVPDICRLDVQKL